MHLHSFSARCGPSWNSSIICYTATLAFPTRVFHLTCYVSTLVLVYGNPLSCTDFQATNFLETVPVIEMQHCWVSPCCSVHTSSFEAASNLANFLRNVSLLKHLVTLLNFLCLNSFVFHILKNKNYTHEWVSMFWYTQTLYVKCIWYYNYVRHTDGSLLMSHTSESENHLSTLSVFFCEARFLCVIALVALELAL